MFRTVGIAASRAIYPILVLWVAFLVVTYWVAPLLRDVVENGEFAFLPESMHSREAERLYRQAFPQVPSGQMDSDQEGRSVQQDPLGSNVVIVVSREDRPDGLTAEDFAFLDEHLLPRLREIAAKTPPGYEFVPLQETDQELDRSSRVVQAIWSRNHRRIGPMLDSADGKSTLIVVELSLELYDRQNQLLIGRIEALLDDPALREHKPLALSLALSGSATVGRDMLQAETESSHRTDTATKILVVVLLLAIYRAPLLAIVPLLTVGMAVTITMQLLRIMAGWGWVGLFNGLHVYVVVVVYGSGVDYCLFLIARYKEELDRGGTFREAMARSVRHVGPALATSAGTSIVGIGMLAFTEFGKFQQAGIAIAFGLFVALCCALTFTPALLVALDRWVFWPDMRQERLSAEDGWIPAENLSELWAGRRWIASLWDQVGRMLKARPGTIFFSVIALLTPFVIVALLQYRDLSYGLLTDLPADRPSVIGARAIQQHFPAGVSGPTTALIVLDEPIAADLSSARAMIETEHFSQAITEAILERREELNISDIRSQHNPLGISQQAANYYQSMSATVRRITRGVAFRTYVSSEGELARRVFRFDFILDEDPFSRNGITHINRLTEALEQAIPEEHRASAKVLLLGSTSSIRDLQVVTDRDQVRINVLVSVSVCLVLMMMLRRFSLSVFLIFSVIFSFLVAWGATYSAFSYWYGNDFAGLDWKVPIYLFTLLLALGEDYNILLMSRIREEQQRHGTIEGILQALRKTGGIISSCGIIMAGTLASLMSGTLMGLVQLGFALAFGVLLDTFVVRPVIVPSWLLLVNSGKFGRLAPWLGGERVIVPQPEEPRSDPSLDMASAPPSEVETPITEV